jgi:outer membrane protein OmpA-like peptidoglycan-associated protein
MIQIDGYTDTWGSFENNTRVSELRVINIKNLLVLKGVSKDKIQINYHGEIKPTGDCILYYP